MLLTAIVRIPREGVKDYLAYEDCVLLPLLHEHCATLERRLRTADGTTEVHVVHFPSRRPSTSTWATRAVASTRRCLTRRGRSNGGAEDGRHGISHRRRRWGDGERTAHHVHALRRRPLSTACAMPLRFGSGCQVRVVDDRLRSPVQAPNDQRPPRRAAMTPPSMSRTLPVMKPPSGPSRNGGGGDLLRVYAPVRWPKSRSSSDSSQRRGPTSLRRRAG